MCVIQQMIIRVSVDILEDNTCRNAIVADIKGDVIEMTSWVLDETVIADFLMDVADFINQEKEGPTKCH